MAIKIDSGNASYPRPGPGMHVYGELSSAMLPKHLEPRLIRIQLVALATILEIPEPDPKALSELKGPAFNSFCKAVQAGIKAQFYKNPSRSFLARQLLELIRSGSITKGPEGFRPEVVAPAELNGGIIYGMQKPCQLSGKDGREPILAVFERELAEGKPQYLNFTIGRDNVLSARKRPSFRYQARLTAEFGYQRGNDLDRHSFNMAIASLAGSREIVELPERMHRARKTFKFVKSGITVRWDGAGEGSVTITSPEKASLKALRLGAIQEMNDVMEAIIPGNVTSSVVERLLAVAAESDKLKPGQEPVELTEFSPFDKECTHFLFSQEDEKGQEGRAGKKGSYPIESPVRDCVQNIFALGGGMYHELVPDIIRLSGKENPRMLFLPTAGYDSEGKVQETFREFKYNGAECKALYLLKDPPPVEEMQNAFNEADIIFVGGGNTHMMMRCFARHGVDKLLEQAARRGAVLSGSSAGAICWFQSGNSDSLRYYSESSRDFVRVRGLDLVDAVLVPHWHPASERRSFLEKQLMGSRNVAIGLDEGVGIHIKDDQYKIIRPPGRHIGDQDYEDFRNDEGEGDTSRWRRGWRDSFGRMAQRMFWEGPRFIIEDIPVTQEYRPVAELLDKTRPLSDAAGWVDSLPDLFKTPKKEKQ